jgi:outer membrane beta-barrel protein
MPAMTRLRSALPVAALAVSVVAPALAQQQRAPATEQVVVPQVERRDVSLPRFPSKDIEVGAFLGTYATESFGASAVVGLRFGYHFTEDMFMEATLAQTKVSDDTFRQVLPGGVFGGNSQTLKYVNLSTGFNVLPGEVFLGSRRAKATAVYLIGGVGSTHFNEQRRQTLNFGLGMRVLLAERWAVRVDMRDHVFSLDLLGKRQSTQNLEFSAGVSRYF